MAERRMFAKTIIDSDAFLDMPVTARLLYYDLSMRADDDGFVNSPKKICRMIGASQDDLSLLILKKFIIPFDNGVVVIKHWRIHNYIRTDTYKETCYKEQKKALELDENKSYRLRNVHEPSTERPRLVDEPLTQDRIGKDRIGKDKREGGADAPALPSDATKRFIKPTVDEIRQFCADNGYHVDADIFYDYYNSNGWKVGKSSMKDWKAAVRNWNRRENGTAKAKTDTSYSKSEIERHSLEKYKNK